MPKKDQPAFEDRYRKLEETVAKLEKGGLSLEESITLYEEGMELAKSCQAMLNSAEQRITKLRESFQAPEEEAEPQPVEEE